MRTRCNCSDDLISLSVDLAGNTFHDLPALDIELGVEELSILLDDIFWVPLDFPLQLEGTTLVMSNPGPWRVGRMDSASSFMAYSLSKTACLSIPSTFAASSFCWGVTNSWNSFKMVSTLM